MGGGVKEEDTMKSDTDLRRDVLDEIDWEPSIVDASQIGVTVKEGVVTLTGHIPLMSEKHAAEVVAKRVHGVRAVANDIEVRPPRFPTSGCRSLSRTAGSSSREPLTGNTRRLRWTGLFGT